eukprot:SAG31_NODE_8086_length_1525_cov_1.744741_2_plen_171_part_00
MKVRGRTIRATIDTELGYLMKEDVAELIDTQGFPEIRTRLEALHRAGTRYSHAISSSRYIDKPSLRFFMTVDRLPRKGNRMRAVQRIKEDGAGMRTASNMKEMMFLQADILEQVNRNTKNITGVQSEGQHSDNETNTAIATKDNGVVAELSNRLLVVEGKLDRILSKMES